MQILTVMLKDIPKNVLFRTVINTTGESDEELVEKTCARHGIAVPDVVYKLGKALYIKGDGNA